MDRRCPVAEVAEQPVLAGAAPKGPSISGASATPHASQLMPVEDLNRSRSRYSASLRSAAPAGRFTLTISQRIMWLSLSTMPMSKAWLRWHAASERVQQRHLIEDNPFATVPFEQMRIGA